MLFLNILRQFIVSYKLTLTKIYINGQLVSRNFFQKITVLFSMTSKSPNNYKTYKLNSSIQNSIFVWNQTIQNSNTRNITATPSLNQSSPNVNFFNKTVSYNNVLLTQMFNFSYSNYMSYILFKLSSIINKSFGFSFYYIQGFIFVLFIDACLTDDEPLWEPLEWSLVQTWILFIFTFAWIAENLIVSRYGSYTGRDKRVWMSWYKTFWLIEGYYIINYGAAAVFVIVPFYFETNYNLSFVYSWWHWYSRVFFFKIISILTLTLLLSYYLQITLRWLNYKKALFLVLLINIFLSYLIYTQFIITFLGFFTDPVWYQKTRPIDYIQLSHEPARWGWGSAKKDHFTYHGVKTVFWFKNDGPFASAMIFFQTFLFICIFFLYIYWITLFRRIWSMKEVPLTLTTYCVSSLRQFFYYMLWMYILVLISYLSNYSRLPIEFLWAIDNTSWFDNWVQIVYNYPNFLKKIFFS